MQLGLGVVVSMVFLVFALKGIELEAFLAAMKGADILHTLPILALMLVAVFWLKAWRWQLILRPVVLIPTRRLIAPVLIGFMGNNLYPARLGEFLRAHALCKVAPIPFSAAFSTLVIERLMDFIVILIYFYSAVFLLETDAIPEDVKLAALGFAIGTAFAVLLLIPFIYIPERALALLARLLSPLPTRMADWLNTFAKAGAEGLAVCRSPALLAGSFVISLVHWLLYSLMILVSLRAFGPKLTVVQAIFVQGGLAFAVALPSSPGFFGIVQWVFRKALTIFDIDPAKAVAASMYYQLSQYIPVTILGLFCLRILGVSVEDARDKRESDTDSPEDDQSEVVSEAPDGETIGEQKPHEEQA